MSGVDAVVKFCGAAAVLLTSIFSLVASVETATNAFSQGKFDKEFRVRSWTTENGLPQNTVLSLLQASDGYLWIGTFEGLVRFDGLKFTVFNRLNTPAFHDHTILSIAESPAGCLWLGTKDGLVRYMNHQFEHFSLAGEVPVKVRAICPRKRGGLWLGAEASLIQFEAGKAKVCRDFRTGVTDLIEDPAGTLWVGDGNHLARLRSSESVFETVVDQANVIRLVADADGAIWFGNHTGVYRVFEGQVTQYPPTANGFHGMPLTLCSDRQSGLWLATYGGGISRLVDGHFEHYTSPTGLSDEDIMAICPDREGNLWFGTRSGGLNLVRPRLLTTLTTADGMAHNDVWSISEAPDGSMWIATSGGLSHYNYGSFRTRLSDLPPHTPFDNEFRLVCVDNCGVPWVTTRGLGLCRLGAKGLTQPFADLADDTVRVGADSIYKNSSGAMWFAGQGLFRLDDGGWKIWRAGDGSMDRWHVIPERQITGLLQDKQGAIWIGTKGGGVCRLRGDSVDQFTRSNGFPADVAAPTLADPDGTVWCGSDEGLIRFKNEKFFLISTQQGLFENIVYNVLEDDFGWLWLNGNQGLQRLRKNDAQAVADGTKPRLTCIHYGEPDGMLSAEGNGESLPNSCKARDGRLWFPTIKGVVIVDPRQLQYHEVPPSVVIEQVVADRQVVVGDAAEEQSAAPQTVSGNTQVYTVLHLPPGRARSLLIRYTANTFVSPDKVRFQYQLVGHDSDWKEDRTNLRTAIYTDLSPGSYQFRVRAFNSHGVASVKNAEFAFSLAPHFYQTWPFYVLCAVGVLSLGGSLHAIRVAGLNRIKALEQLHALELERARIARDMHDSLGADLTKIALLAQVATRQNGHGDQDRNWERVAGLAGGLVDGIGELVWATNPKNNNLDSLAAYIREYAVELFDSVGVAADLDFPAQIPALEISGEMRRNLFLAVKEALTNITKHAQATRVTLSFCLSHSAELQIKIQDYGKGFNPQQRVAGNGAGHGNGLRHLRERLTAAGGNLDLDSSPGSGTTVRMTIPLSMLACDQDGRSAK